MDRLLWMLAEIPLTSGKGMFGTPLCEPKTFGTKFKTPRVKISDTFLFVCFCLVFFFRSFFGGNLDWMSLCEQNVCQYLLKTICLCDKIQRPSGVMTFDFLCFVV